MTTVLAAIDDSAAAHPVLATALALAPILDARVLAVHVANDDNHGRTASKTAEAMNVTLRRVGGDPFEQIRHMANEDEVAAVVLGARARPTGRRPAGHVALALAGAIAKPLVLVPPDAQTPARIARVLIALKGTPRSARELLGIVQLGAAAELDLVVVHVDDEDTIPAFSDQAQYDTQDYANEFLTRYCRGAPEARLVLRVGLPVDEILATVDEVDPDMLAIGWPHTSDPNRARIAREIVSRSHVPVLVATTRDPTT